MIGKFIRKHFGKGAAVALVAGIATVSAIGGATAASYITYNQFDSATKAKVDNVRAFVASSNADVTIAKIGGPITDNGTVVPGIDLTGFSGNFIATISGQVDRTTAASVPGKAVQPQFSLWADCDNDGVFEWKNGEGVTSPNATIPDQKDRSVTINGTAKLRVWKSCHTKLIAFGYASDGSAAGSGELTAAKGVTVTLVPYR
jgi:hypothetical protein